MTADDYQAQLQALLARGPAWPTDPSATLTALLGAMAQEFSRVDAKAETLLTESDPRTTYELLEEWEYCLGLPDPCTGVLTQLDQRRLALALKLAATGGQSRQYFIDLVKNVLDIDITIDEKVGGDPFKWQVNAPSVPVYSFQAGVNAAGDALRWWSNKLLECVINRYKPAHTEVIFAYA